MEIDKLHLFLLSIVGFSILLIESIVESSHRTGLYLTLLIALFLLGKDLLKIILSERKNAALAVSGVVLCIGLCSMIFIKEMAKEVIFPAMLISYLLLGRLSKRIQTTN